MDSASRPAEAFVVQLTGRHMGFSYSCFISYVHSGIPPPGPALIRQFVDEFEGLLAEELEAQVDEPIFRDNEELSGGDVVGVAAEERAIVAVARERATPGLVFYDLKRCLAAVADET